MFERYQPNLNAYVMPPGTAYEEQQFAALMLETAGALKIPDTEKAALAVRIGQRMEGS
jgi:hypothetical protein